MDSALGRTPKYEISSRIMTNTIIWTSALSPFLPLKFGNCLKNNVKMLGSSPNSMISRFCSQLLDLFYTKYSNTRLNLYVIIFCCWHLVHTEQHACFVSPNLHFHKKKYFMQKYQRRKINMLATQHIVLTQWARKFKKVQAKKNREIK